MFSETINGVELTFETAETLFSPNSVDKGTLAMVAMLSVADFAQGDKVLDLGCGYGVVGIYSAKLTGAQNVFMSDVEPLCVELSRKNAELNNVGNVTVIRSDGFSNIGEKDFALILSNPPYHSDFSTPKQFIEKGFNRLKIGGKMLMVTKRRDWYKNKFISVFGGVKIEEIDGYCVFCAERRCSQYAKR
ncbi:MAG: methyltransferase [Oscillospiraceae bacterium]|nr:methyltransferase [Oscillospiraceae bacterium]